MQLNFHLNDYHINPEAKPNVFAFKLKEPFFFDTAAMRVCVSVRVRGWGWYKGDGAEVTTKNPPTL